MIVHVHHVPDPEVIRLLRRILRKVSKRRSKRIDAFVSTVTSNGVTITGRIEKMELREGQQVNATVSLKTKSGHDAAYEVGSAAWSSSDPAVGVVVDPTNELKAVVTGLDGSANAAAVVTFTADGDPDADQTRDVVATLDVVCTTGEAVVAEISTDTPVDVP